MYNLSNVTHVVLFIMLIYRFTGWKHRVDDGTTSSYITVFLDAYVRGFCFVFFVVSLLSTRKYVFGSLKTAFGKVFMCIQETQHLLCATGGHNQMVQSSLFDDSMFVLSICCIMLHVSSIRQHWPLVTVALRSATWIQTVTC